MCGFRESGEGRWMCGCVMCEGESGEGVWTCLTVGCGERWRGCFGWGCR